MNMDFLTIQLKSEDSRFPMNGKTIHIANVHYMGGDAEKLIVKYEDNQYKMHEIQYDMPKVSYFFVS